MARLVLALGLAVVVALSGCVSNPPGGQPSGNTTAPGGTGGSGGSGGAGGSGNNTGGGNATGALVELAVSTSGQYPVNPGFDPATLSAPAGRTIHLTFTNADTLPLPISHDWVLDGVDGAATETVDNGASTEVTFAAPPPGEYTYFCSVGDHRARGMEGTLTVA